MAVIAIQYVMDTAKTRVIIGRGSGSPSSSNLPGGARRDRQTRPDVVVRGDASVSRHHVVISYRSGGRLDAPGRFSLRVLGEKHALLAAAAATSDKPTTETGAPASGILLQAKDGDHALDTGMTSVILVGSTQILFEPVDSLLPGASGTAAAEEDDGETTEEEDGHHGEEHELPRPFPLLHATLGSCFACTPELVVREWN